MDDGGADGGAAASLRKQLRAKDAELRQVHAGMARWREQTAARLALRLEEALTAELERYVSGRASLGGRPGPNLCDASLEQFCV